MAEIESRHNPKSGTTTWRVRWREDGRRPAYTFNDAPHNYGPAAPEYAQLFRELVEANGDRLPLRHQLERYGLAGILEQHTDPAPAPAPAPVAAADMSVSEMMSRYLDYRAALGIKVPEDKTLKGYRGDWARHVARHPFGALAQATCTFRDVEAWQADLLTRLSANTVRKIRAGLIAPAFTWACSVRSEQTPNGAPLRTLPSPLLDTLLPQKIDPQKKDRLKTPEQAAIFFAAAWQVDPEAAAMWTIAALTGMRHQELAALDVTDARPFENVLLVRARMSGTQRLRRTKNRQVREVPIPEWAMRAIIVPRLSRRGALFIGPGGHRWDDSTERQRYLATGAKMAAAGLPLHITSHCMRHTARTWLASHDIHPAKIDMFLGHKRRSIGDGYDELTERDADRIRQIMSTLIPASTCPAAAGAAAQTAGGGLSGLRSAAR